MECFLPTLRGWTVPDKYPNGERSTSTVDIKLILIFKLAVASHLVVISRMLSP